MKFVFLIGNTSVGKMTVGQELTKITNLKLFHNHMMIEPVILEKKGYRTVTGKTPRKYFYENYYLFNDMGVEQNVRLQR